MVEPVNEPASATGILANSRRVLPDAFWSLTSNVLGVIAGLAVVKIIGAMVPAADYGQAGLVLGVVGLLTQFIANPILSTQLRLFFEHAAKGTGGAHFAALQKLLTKVALVIMAAYLAVAFGYRLGGSAFYLALALPALLLIVVQPHLSANLNLLEAQRKYRAMTIAQSASKLLQVPVLLGLLYVASVSKASAVILSQALALLVVLVWILATREKLPSVETAVAAPALTAFDSFAGALYAFNLFSWVLATSDRYLIDHFQDPQQVGVYVLNYALWSIPFTVLNGWIDSFSRPRLYTRAAAGNWGQVVEVMRAKLMAAFGISLFGAGAIFFLGEPISRILIGANYWAGLPLVMLIALAHVFFVTGHTASTIFVAAKKAQPLWITTLIAAGLNVGLNLHYIPKFGIIAAAGSTLAAYALWTILLLGAAFVMKRTLRESIQSSAAQPAV